MSADRAVLDVSARMICAASPRSGEAFISKNEPSLMFLLKNDMMRRKKDASGGGGRRDESMEYSAAYRLADEIRNSEEYRTYHGLKDEVMGDETQAALIREYRRMQMAMQMNLMTGQPNDPEETQRFSALGGLLFSKPQVSQFLLAEMRLQQTLADVMKIVTDATGLEIQMPG